MEKELIKAKQMLEATERNVDEINSIVTGSGSGSAGGKIDVELWKKW